MPRQLTLRVYDPDLGHDVEREFPVATKSELLKFANRVREAGGANVLDALLPAAPQVSSACLIARALNFECEVQGFDSATKFPEGDDEWGMFIFRGNDQESEALTEQIATKLNLRTARDGGTEGDPLCLVLPRHIGNAAWAFDQGRAFLDLNEDHLLDCNELGIEPEANPEDE